MWTTATRAARCWQIAGDPFSNNFEECAGEPFNNFEEVMKALQIATHPRGLHFSKNKVTVSTVGLVPQIRRFCRSRVPAQLAVSLHAPNDQLRSQIVPVNSTHSLPLLMDALRCASPR